MTCIGIGGLLSRHRERHQRDHARALDGDADLALVLRAIARDAPRDDLAAIGDEVFEGLRIFVIDIDVLIGAEPANLAARKAALAGGLGFIGGGLAALLIAALAIARRHHLHAHVAY